MSRVRYDSSDIVLHINRSTETQQEPTKDCQHPDNTNHSTKNATMPFTCGLCLEDHRASRSTCVVFPNGDEVCTSCFRESIVDQFWNSIRNPSAFPFHWGGTALRFQDYAQYIPGYQSMLRMYNAKRDELETPPELRVHCDRDGSFLGAKQGVEVKYECDLCGRIVCASCTKHATDNHVCRRDSRADAFEGLEKGKDVQFCPTCSAPCVLADGCNSVTCANCREQFCFLCAEAVQHGDKQHWQPGMNCPRFGRPGAPNALYDDQVRVLDDINEAPNLVVGGQPFLHWGPLFRARVAPAREQLDEIKDNLRRMRWRMHGFNANLEHTLELVSELSRNYGFFLVNADDNEFEPAEREAIADGSALVRHRAIRDFDALEIPAADWAWTYFPDLMHLRRWYLNHFEVHREQRVAGHHIEVQIWANYGNPEHNVPFRVR